MKQLKLAVETRHVGSTMVDYIDLPDGWDEMEPSERAAWAEAELEDHISNNVDGWFEVVEDGEE
jgi:hypothetical protein